MVFSVRYADIVFLGNSARVALPATSPRFQPELTRGTSHWPRVILRNAVSLRTSTFVASGVRRIVVGGGLSGWMLPHGD